MNSRSVEIFNYMFSLHHPNEARVVIFEKKLCDRINPSNPELLNLTINLGVHIDINSYE